VYLSNPESKNPSVKILVLENDGAISTRAIVEIKIKP
jgi:hypothetical protein